MRRFQQHGGGGGSTCLYSRFLKVPSEAASKPLHCLCTLLCTCSTHHTVIHDPNANQMHILKEVRSGFRFSYRPAPKLGAA